MLTLTKTLGIRCAKIDEIFMVFFVNPFVTKLDDMHGRSTFIKAAYRALTVRKFKCESKMQKSTKSTLFS